MQGLSGVRKYDALFMSPEDCVKRISWTSILTLVFIAASTTMNLFQKYVTGRKMKVLNTILMDELC